MIDKVIFDKLMMRYRHLGTRKIETTGAFLIGNASHIASEAWLNSVYPCKFPILGYPLLDGRQQAPV